MTLRFRLYATSYLVVPYGPGHTHHVLCFDSFQVFLKLQWFPEPLKELNRSLFQNCGSTVRGWSFLKVQTFWADAFSTDCSLVSTQFVWQTLLSKASVWLKDTPGMGVGLGFDSRGSLFITPLMHQWLTWIFPEVRLLEQTHGAHRRCDRAWRTKRHLFLLRLWHLKQIWSRWTVSAHFKRLFLCFSFRFVWIICRFQTLLNCCVYFCIWPFFVNLLSVIYMKDVENVS